MTIRADNTQAALQVIVDSVTSPAAGDVQVVELATIAAGVVTPVTAAAPLPVTVAGSGASLIGGGFTLLRGTINFATATTPTLVSAVGGKSIYVVSYALVAAGPTTVQWVSANASPLNLSGPMSLAGTGGIVAVGTPTAPLLWTNAGDPLALANGAAVQISGHYTYFVV